MVVITKRHLDPQSGAVTLTMRSETYAKHAFALGKTTTPPPTPALQSIDRTALGYAGINNMVIQFSIDGSTLWHTPNATGDLYLRVSSDGGATFGPAQAIGGGDTVIPYLTNESAAVAADSAGTITGSLGAASGSMDLIQGTAAITSGVTFSVVSGSTTGGLSISINSSSGAYTVSALTGDQGTATLRATYGSVSYDKIYTLTKQKQGAAGVAGLNAPLLTLSSTAQTMTFDAGGAASPSSQTISLTAVLQNVTGTAAFVATAYNSGSSSLGTITLGGSGNTRTLTNTLFNTYANTAYVVVVASLSGLSDTETFVRLQAGSNGVTPLLTNEAATVAADNAGTVGSFGTAGGTMQLYLGSTLISSASITFSVVSSSGVTISINSAGTYSISAMSADQGSATLRGVYGGVNYDKVYNIAKSKAGTAGNAGSDGLGTSGLSLSSGVTYAGGTLDLPANPGVFTSQGAWTGVLAGPSMVTFKVSNAYSGNSDIMVGLRPNPSSSFNFTSTDYYTLRVSPGYNTGNATNDYEIYESGVYTLTGGNNSYSSTDTYSVKYDGLNIVYSRVNSSGTLTVIRSVYVGPNRAFGVQVIASHPSRITNFGFSASGANGSGGSSSSSVALDVTTVNWPSPVTLEDGESIAAAYHLGAGSFSGGGSATVTTWMEISLSGAGSYSTISGTSASNGYVAGDQLSQDGSGSFTNSSGGRKAYDVRFRYSKSGTPNPGAVDHTTSTMTLG
jgi:hypothetical protein